MFAEFMIRAFLSGLGVAILTGVLGCFVIWRRMVYFGDALSHAAILGVVGAIALNVSVYFGVIALALILSVLLFTLTSRIQGADVILGVFAQTGLALGLIGASIWGRGLSIEAILFGDILAVGWRDIIFIWIGVAVILGIVFWRWSNWITATLGDDLAGICWRECQA
jgi:zinc transport system permease protein